MNKLKEKDNVFTLTNTIYMNNCDNSSSSMLNTLTKIIFEVFQSAHAAPGRLCHAMYMVKPVLGKCG